MQVVTRDIEFASPTTPEGATKYQIVADAHALEALKEEWRALYERAAEPYFSQSFEWCWTSWENVGKARGRGLHCVVGWQNDRAVLIWPFVTCRKSLWSMLLPLGTETTEYGSVLVEDRPDADHLVARAWETLRNTCPGDVIALPLVRTGSSLHRLLAHETMPSYVETDPTSYVSLMDHTSWEAYERSLGSDTRRKIARTRRRLRERGALVFEPVVEAAACEDVIDWVLRQKRQRLAETNRGNAWIQTPEYRNFLLAMTRQDGSSGRLIVSVLRLDGEVIAADISRVDKVRVEGVNKVFHPDFGAYGLGQMVQEDCLKWTFAQGRNFDFRLGSEPYKRHWASGWCDVISYELANSSWGSAYIAYRHTARRISRLRYLVPSTWRKRLKAMLRSTLPGAPKKCASV